MADQLNLNQTRVVDPILTTIAQGYADPDFVGSVLFPRVPVVLSGGQIIEFDKAAFLKYNSTRAPGAATKRIEVGYLGKPYALENHALEAVVPREQLRDARVSPGLDIAAVKVKAVMSSMLRELEIQQATLATTLGNYDSNHKITLSGTSQFSDATAKPITAIDGYKETIRGSCGTYPNTIVFGPKAWKAFKNNPNVTDRIKYTQRGVIAEDIAANLLGIPNVRVGTAVSASADGTFSDIWGNNIVLAYTATGGLDAAQPSYGYTYTMQGHPLTEAPYWDNNAKSWVYGVSFERAPVLSGITSGFLISGVSA